MDSLPVILDISSDEEQGSSAETKSGDWLSALFGNLNSDDDVEADDDVVVVREVVNENHRKSRKSTAVVKDVDDDCIVLDCDPNNPVAEVNDDKDNSGSDDLLIVAEKGQIACRDYPHPRHLCVKYPFSSTSHDKHCDQCHCYVCECSAPCPFWDSDSVILNRHCHATDKEERWKTFRRQLKPIKNTTFSAVKCSDSTLSVPLARCNQAQSLNFFRLPNSMPLNQVARSSLIRPCSTSNNYTVPNIISQGKSQQSAPILAKNRVHPHVISQQFVGVRHSVTQRDRDSVGNLGPRIPPSNTLFKKTGSVKPSSVYVSSNNNSCIQAAQHTRNATSTALSNEINPNRWQNFRSSVNLESFRPQDCSQPNLGFTGNIIPSQPQIYNQSIAQSNDGQNFCLPGYQSQKPSEDIYQNGNCLNDGQNISQHGNQSFSTTEPGPLFFNFSWPNNSVQSNLQPPIGNLHVQSEGYTCESLSVEDSNSQFMGSAQFSEDSLPELFGCASPCPSDQVPAVENSELQSTGPMHEASHIKESNCELAGNINDFDIDNWFLENQSVPMVSGGSMPSETNIFSPVTSSIDPGMLLFDFETSWDGLAHA
ncbi:uncharacterized protein LOC142619858 [Castanea sativa]|uniref:uncharacterized protein LOC142619858 n=1 Tax=Castanea sativa TaxID=21020 RepID=UPI003F64B098